MNLILSVPQLHWKIRNDDMKPHIGAQTHRTNRLCVSLRKLGLGHDGGIFQVILYDSCAKLFARFGCPSICNCYRCSWPVLVKHLAISFGIEDFHGIDKGHF